MAISEARVALERAHLVKLRFVGINSFLGTHASKGPSIYSASNRLVYGAEGRLDKIKTEELILRILAHNLAMKRK